METFLGYCFSHKCIKKRYRALCPGTIEPASGVIDSPISGKESITKYQVVKVTPSFRFGTITTVDLWPLQGRRHQLRIHLKSIGHAILGDPRYSPHILATPDENKMCLWALGVEFPDPTLHVTTKQAVMDQCDTVIMNVNSNDESKETDGNERLNEKRDRKTPCVADSIVDYDVETLLQGLYKSIEIEEPNLFEIVRSMQQWDAHSHASAASILQIPAK